MQLVQATYDHEYENVVELTQHRIKVKRPRPEPCLKVTKPDEFYTHASTSIIFKTSLGVFGKSVATDSKLKFCRVLFRMEYHQKSAKREC